MIVRFTTKARFKKDLLRRLFKIGGGRCIWCNCEVEICVLKERQLEPDNMATVDHLIPRPFRQKGELSPKVLSCNKCNSLRGAMYEKRFTSLLKKYE